jgi:PAS domain S-box-containing protein
MRYSEDFQRESQQLHHRRVYPILLAGVGVMLLFTALDAFLIPHHFYEFLRYRLCAVGMVGLLLVANAFDRRRRRAWLIGFAGYICAGGVILFTVLRTGGVASPYYVGLIVTMTTYTALAPLTVGQTLISGLALVCLYLLSVSFSDALTPYQVTSLFSNLFFMICFVFIAATQSWADVTARRQESRLRRAENQAAERLAHLAEHLEQEVKRRTAEQKSSELRYRILYEAIADYVILIAPEGAVLQANNSYLLRFYGGRAPLSASFFDVVQPFDRPRVAHELLRRLDQGALIADWRLTLQAPGQLVEVEISGAQLTRSEKKLGLQLVIRDIGIRQELERNLHGSLNKIRQTENAAILALAKLSEYRDVNPGNHLERIREYCRILAADLAEQPAYAPLVTPAWVQNLYQGVILHDIGKVAIPDHILTKTGSLTAEEETLQRQHTIRGGDVIKAMQQEVKDSGFLSLAQNVAYFHHERWDGQGYPDGLHGEQIPLEARVMAVADAYEEWTAALDPNRRLPHLQAVQHIVDETGQRFDPALVEAFMRQQDAFNRVRQIHAEPSLELGSDAVRQTVKTREYQG